MKKKEQVQGITVLYVRAYDIAAVIRIVIDMMLAESRHIGEWNGPENTEIDLPNTLIHF